MMFAGIDPGQKGGMASLYIDNGKPVLTKALNTPCIDFEGNKSFDALTFNENLPMSFIAVLERVHAMPGQGVSSTFQFGRMYGAVEAVLDMTANEIIYVLPGTWKKYFGLIHATKRESIQKANEIFGYNEAWNRRGRRGGENIDENSGPAEAALIALWGAVNHG